MSDLVAHKRKGCDLQIRAGKPIALDLSTALVNAITSDSKSSKPIKPPTRRVRLTPAVGVCFVLCYFLHMHSRNSQAFSLLPKALPATGQLYLLPL